MLIYVNYFSLHKQYQLLMTEAILAFYSRNTWSNIHSKRTKNSIHWILQLIGAVLAIVGTLLLYVPRKRHFSTLHSQTGKCFYFTIVFRNLEQHSPLLSLFIFSNRFSFTRSFDRCNAKWNIRTLVCRTLQKL